MKQKTRDSLIYLSVGLTIVAVFTTYMFYNERAIGTIREIPGAILWGIFSTPVLVGLILERHWQFRRRRSLWVVATTAASINLLGMLIAYRFRWNPRAVVWAVIMLPWFTVALIAAEKFVVRDSRSE